MSTPPPYTDITGIYTASNKHQEVTKENYDGLAKPGQLVVDTSDYSLWIGDDQGNLNEVSAGTGPFSKLVAGSSELVLNADGSVLFPDSSLQTTAYAGGVGRMIMIDTNRDDNYTEVGSTDRPFKTFSDAITAADAIATAPGATADDKRFTFVLMGCTVSEDVDFSGTALTAVTISTACRSVITGDVTIASMPTLSQVVIRNIEIGGTFTITGDGTSEQLNNVSIYNASFSGAVNITATNATAFYEVAFFGVVTFTNLSYLYINGAQFNTDWTIRADDTGSFPIPSRGLNPGTGGSLSIVLNIIANNVFLVKGGTAVYVFQPHISRMGRTTENYTVPAGWFMTAYSSVFRGTWTNEGTIAMRNSSSDNRIKGTAPTYSGIIGGEKVVAKSTPATSKGVEGDREGMIAADADYLYVCVADWTDGMADIWSRTAITASTW